MNFDNLFRVCLGFCLLLLAFTLVANFVDGLGIFPYTSDVGVSGVTEANALTKLTKLTGGMEYIFLGVTTLALAGTVALCWAIKNITPLGIYFFSLVFWTSWLRMASVFSYGGGGAEPYIPVALIGVFTIGVMFVFIGAIIGMMTGS